MPANVPSVVFIGGGPRAAGVLERLAANRSELFAGPLDVHVVEPYEPGSGRIWRSGQHPGLLLNSTASDITMFTDGSVTCEGPAVPGPGLAEWAEGVLDGSITDVPDLPGPLRQQLMDLDGGTFPTRQLQSQYLEWFFRRAVLALGPGATVTTHRSTAIGIEPVQLTEPIQPAVPAGSAAASPPASAPAASDGAGYRIRLASGTVLHADVVLTALGHTDAWPDARSQALTAFARQHGLFHAVPSYTTDVDYSALQPGQDVIVAGMGLAFVDLLVLLMEGRGGTFKQLPDGGLEYVPSGREPRVWAGSRRGVPYHSKISAAAAGAHSWTAKTALEFFTAEAVNALLDRHSVLDFREHLWPLIAKEAGFGYYRALLTTRSSPAGSWEEFAGRYAELDWADPRLAGLVASFVPDPELRLDLGSLDRPLAGRQFGSVHAVQEAVTAHIIRDLELRDSPGHPESQGLFLALLGIYMELGRLVPASRLNGASQETIHGWWHGFFSFVDSGPPPHRLRQLLALNRAGLVRFLGPGLTVTADGSTGTFSAQSSQADFTVNAPAYIEARLPSPAVACSANPLLAALHRTGLGSEQQVLAADGIRSTGKLLVSAGFELINSDGHLLPRLLGLGPWTSVWGAGAFARPGTNAAPFRENDAVARNILRLLAAVPGSNSTAKGRGHGRESLAAAAPAHPGKA
ncbi:FAD/NAD(P)-binding protein [Pseudarthrobacter sp. J75]|uniref:FAD/NAD(P)-binding protein n=1 Tax=unclassified Pseudarthrobacter TaxID=2647000 RepID=UPI002E804369|nr:MULTISPECIES: FAD/NAD(P)-binding protein [unclassified Pseudarthrobacter]MEE2524265.1 FAD/NAD(P)-binding protein [Pseudarthrobacter sp. J47]MEE2530139.1 FAD/NAD(P)-binding protein [Pseudarthrobacter sp. J75]